ncbi:MAG: c-type cytochrome [Planctomycetes bacterium]|nr:c-type cytochrome [Planctomycetota bacterium]
MKEAVPLQSTRCRNWLGLLLALSSWSTAVAAELTEEDPPAPSTHAIVAGFERFFTGSAADTVHGGRLLLGELNCTSCHAAEGLSEAFVLRKQAPILDGVGARVKRTWLRRFLSDPHSVKPGTTMPDLFAGVTEPEKERQVESLVHFLASTGTVSQARPDQRFVPNGQKLYHQVGCVACHGPLDESAQPAVTRATSVPLGDLASKYTIPSLIAFLQDPLKVRPSGRMPGLLSGDETRDVAHYLVQATTFEPQNPTLAYTYYEGTWDRLPDFDKLTPIASGQAAGFELGVAQRANDMAVRFEGFLRIEREGVYTFHLTSDDGSRLTIRDGLVVDNDGIHSPTTKSGPMRLNRGNHKLVASVFNRGGGVELQVEIEGPGLERQSIEPMLFLSPGAVPVKPLPNDDPFVLDRALVEKGRELFARVGCANCHTLRLGNKPIEPRLVAGPLGKLKPDGGCLGTLHTQARRASEGGRQAPPVFPQYNLSPKQQTSLAAAIRAFTTPPADPPAPAQVIADTLTAFNCYACHERDKLGGVEQERDKFFTTTQPEMGDEGRLPPLLTGAGAKLTAAWMRHIFASGSKDRPYMHTRMPKFGEANIGRLVAALESVDAIEPVPRPTFMASTGRVKADARFLVGGQGLSCIKCHIFAGHQAEGVQGIDMTILAQRLRRDWFQRYLIDPQAYRPGTRMPTAWPQGKAVLRDVLDGDTAKQVEAIWLYLSDGGKAAVPQGVVRDAIPLKPQREAIIYRNFIEGAGTRAIAVGYPENVHVAFDAGDLRLALLWQGDFLDAARHWHGRGEGFERPQGDNVISLPSGPSIATLAKSDEPWPTKPAKELGYKFLAYRLTPDERPTFLYSLGAVQIEDSPHPLASNPHPSLRRTLKLAASQPIDTLWFRAAVAEQIERLDDDWHQIGGEWKTRISSASPPRVRDSAGKKELLVPVQFAGGRAEIVQEFVW